MTFGQFLALLNLRRASVGAWTRWNISGKFGFMILDIFLRLIFVLATTLKSTFPGNLHFWFKWPNVGFCWSPTSLMFHPKTGHKSNVYFMYLGQLLRFTCEFGNKHRTLLTKKLWFLVHLTLFWLPVKVTRDLKTGQPFYRMLTSCIFVSFRVCLLIRHYTQEKILKRHSFLL